MMSPPPSSSPYSGAATGTALDVIVVAPSSSPPRRRRSASLAGDAPPSPASAGGVVACSDFFVSFPSGMAWSKSSLRGSATKGLRSTVGAFKASLVRSSTLGASGGAGGGDGNASEEGAEVGAGDWDGRCAASERGTASTEPRPAASPRPLDQGRTQVVQSPTQHQHQPQCSSTERSDPFPSHTKKLQTQPPTRSNGQAYNAMPQSSQRGGNVQIQINGRPVPQLDMMFSSKRKAKSGSIIARASGYGGTNGGDHEPSCRFVDGRGLRPCTEALRALIEDDDGADDGGGAARTEPPGPCRESTRADSIGGRGRRGVLHFGRNLLRYNLLDKRGAIAATAEAHLYLWRSSDSVVVSDVDGTVTRSDVRGVLDTVVQDRFEYCHPDICRFYNQILERGGGGDDDDDDDDDNDNDDDIGECAEEDAAEPAAPGGSCRRSAPPQSASDGGDGGVRFLYLSSRPISLVNQTRKLLVSLSQTCPSTERTHRLPPGPLMCHTGPLASVLYSELWAKNIHEFKADVLARQVVLPFVAAQGEDGRRSSAWSSRASHRMFSNDCVAPPSPMRSQSVREEGDVVNGVGGDFGRSLSGASEASSTWDDRLLIAGFGNKVTDAMAYEMAGMDRRDIYIIDKESRILCMGVDERPSVEEAVGCSSFDPSSHRSAPANLRYSAPSNLCDQSEWISEACCGGGSDGPIRWNSASSGVSDVAVSQIRSIELSLSDNMESEFSGNLVLSKTDVDIVVASPAKPLNKKSKKKKKAIRAFTSMKKSITAFPSFGSASSKTSSKKFYQGYGDPMLLIRIRERMIG